MTDPSSPSDSLVKAISASLKFVNGFVDSLTTSQLAVIQIKLDKTREVIGKELWTRTKSSPKDPGPVVDISDSDSEHAADNGMERDKEEYDTPSIPGPYPTTLPPPGYEAVDTYYVVDHGREVGIFTNSATSTHAVSGVPHGHQVKVKTWHDAATLYNLLYDQGLIVRVEI